MNFGEALTLVKAGIKMSRAGWNGKGMWIEIQRPDAHSKMTLPYLFLNYPHGDKVPWLASQTDMLQDDWMIYVEPVVEPRTVSQIFLKPKNPKLHWTQTPEGKKKMAARRRKGQK
jgi:hypothetical protein